MDKQQRYSRLSEAEQDRILADYEKGMSGHALAARYGRNQSTIYALLKRRGVTRHLKRPHYKGGRVMRQGYVLRLVADGGPLAAAMANGLCNGRYVPEHRLVMAQHLGRPLTANETVHHVNGDRKDNRLENLQLRQGRHGIGVAHRCRDCGSTNVETVELD